MFSVRGQWAAVLAVYRQYNSWAQDAAQAAIWLSLVTLQDYVKHWRLQALPMQYTSSIPKIFRDICILKQDNIWNSMMNTASACSSFTGSTLRHAWPLPQGKKYSRIQQYCYSALIFTSRLGWQTAEIVQKALIMGPATMMPHTTMEHVKICKCTKARQNCDLQCSVHGGPT